MKTIEGKYHQADGSGSKLLITKVKGSQYRIVCSKEGWRTIGFFDASVGRFNGVFTYTREPRGMGYFHFLRGRDLVKTRGLGKKFYVGHYGFHLITLTETGLKLKGGWDHVDGWETNWIRDGKKSKK